MRLTGPMANRDTQFQGFADLLLQEILLDVPLSGQDRLLRQAIQTLIAQRAYDLACHVVEYSGGADMADWPDSEIISNLPDLTQWPESPPPLPDARVEQAPSDDQLL